MSIIDDHSRSLNDFKSMGMPILAPYLGNSCKPMNMGEFTVKPFDLTTIDGHWTHTDANGEPCPIYGFLITHKEMGRMLYITDCQVVKWRFKDINHILLGVNYDKDLIDKDNTGKANHVFRGHLSIDTACDFVKAKGFIVNPPIFTDLQLLPKYGASIGIPIVLKSFNDLLWSRVGGCDL